MEISVVLPAYEEADNLRVILPKLNRSLADLGVEYEIIVVDGQQVSDDSPAVCEENHAIYINQKGKGYGDANREGIAAARGEYLVIMDGDGSHAPETIKNFYNEMSKGKYDLIIGSRYVEGGNSHNGPVLKLMSWVLNLIYRIIFGLNVKDCSGSFRMYKTFQLKQINIECEDFGAVEEILIRLKIKFKDFRVKEIPIYFQTREFGESKRNLLKFIKSYLLSIARLIKLKNSATKK